jgi:hypothetical protein
MHLHYLLQFNHKTKIIHESCLVRLYSEQTSVSKLQITFKIALTSRVFTKNYLKEVTGTRTFIKHKLNYIERYTKEKQRGILCSSKLYFTHYHINLDIDF